MKASRVPRPSVVLLPDAEPQPVRPPSPSHATDHSAPPPPFLAFASPTLPSSPPTGVASTFARRALPYHPARPRTAFPFRRLRVSLDQSHEASVLQPQHPPSRSNRSRAAAPWLEVMGALSVLQPQLAQSRSRLMAPAIAQRSPQTQPDYSSPSADRCAIP